MSDRVVEQGGTLTVLKDPSTRFIAFVLGFLMFAVGIVFFVASLQIDQKENLRLMMSGSLLAIFGPLIFFTAFSQPRALFTANSEGISLSLSEGQTFIRWNELDRVEKVKIKVRIRHTLSTTVVNCLAFYFKKPTVISDKETQKSSKDVDEFYIHETNADFYIREAELPESIEKTISRLEALRGTPKPW